MAKGERPAEDEMVRLLDSNTESIVMNVSKLWEIVEDRGAWCPWSLKESDTT